MVSVKRLSASKISSISFQTSTWGTFAAGFKKKLLIDFALTVFGAMSVLSNSTKLMDYVLCCYIVMKLKQVDTTS